MTTGTTKVAIVYYSMYGHIAELAKKQKAGVDSVPGCEGFLFQVPSCYSYQLTLMPRYGQSCYLPTECQERLFEG
jgi:hypothetical protein